MASQRSDQGDGAPSQKSGFLTRVWTAFSGGSAPTNVEHTNRPRFIRIFEEGNDEDVTNALLGEEVTVEFKGKGKHLKRRVPNNRVLLRPSPQQIKSLRNGGKYGFLTGARVLAATEFVGVNTDHSVYFTIYNGKKTCFYTTDHLEEQEGDEWLVANDVRPNEDGSNLFFVAFEKEKDSFMPSYHFWTKDGDRDPTQDFHFGRELDAEIARKEAEEKVTQNGSPSARPGTPRSPSTSRYSSVNRQTPATPRLHYDDAATEESQDHEKVPTTDPRKPKQYGSSTSPSLPDYESDTSLYDDPPETSKKPLAATHPKPGFSGSGRPTPPVVVLVDANIPKWREDPELWNLFDWQRQSPEFLRYYEHYKRELYENGLEFVIDDLHENDDDWQAWDYLTTALRNPGGDPDDRPLGWNAEATRFLKYSEAAVKRGLTEAEWMISNEFLCAAAERFATVQMEGRLDWWKFIRPDTWWFFQPNRPAPSDDRYPRRRWRSGEPSTPSGSSSSSGPSHPSRPSDPPAEPPPLGSPFQTPPSKSKKPSMHSDRLAFLDDYRDVWDAENAVPYEPEEQQSGPPLRILPAPDSPRTSAAKVRALLTQTPPSVLIEPLPTPEDIRALVPVEGMTFKSLIAAIKPLADRANDKEFLNTVRSVTRVDKTKKLLFLKKEAPVDLGITIPTSSATAREKKRKRNEDRVYQDEPSPVADDELSPVIKKPRKQIDPSYRPGKSPTSPESPSSPIRKPGRPEKNSPADVAYRPATVESAPTSPSVTGRPPKRLRTEGHEAASPFSPRKKRRTERSPAPSPPAHSPPEQWEMKSSSSSSGPASPKKAVKTTAAAETKKQPTAAKAVTPRSPRPTRQAAKDAKGKIEEVLQTTRGKKSDHKTSAKAKPAVKKATKAPAKKTAKAPAKKAPKQQGPKKGKK